MNRKTPACVRTHSPAGTSRGRKTLAVILLFLPVAFRFGFYRFDGWYTVAEGGTKITINTVFSDNTTVYAHWTRINIPFFDPDFWPF